MRISAPGRTLFDGDGRKVVQCIGCGLPIRAGDATNLIRQETNPMLTITAFDHVVFNVRDVEISAAWFERVLGMTRRDSPSPDGGTRTAMFFGRNKINLRPISATQEEWFTGQEPTAASEDLCFLTDAAPDDVVGNFRQCGVTIVHGPAHQQGARGSICSVYVRDPDGNLIEVASYMD